jgi:hypothetical protein
VVPNPTAPKHEIEFARLPRTRERLVIATELARKLAFEFKIRQRRRKLGDGAIAVTL